MFPFPDSRPESYKINWGKLTLKEVLQKSNLDRRVQRRQLAMRDSSGKGLLTKELEDYRAIVRVDDNRVFKIGSKRFQLHQNEDILKLMLDFCDKGHAELANVISFDDGATIAVQAKLNADLVIPGGSKLEGYAMIAWSHDSSVATCFKGTSTYVVCWNTFVQSLRDKSKAFLKVRHSSALSPKIISKAKDILDSLTEDVALTNERMKKFSQVHMDSDDRVKFVLRVLGSNSGSLIEQIAEDQETSLLDQVIIATDIPPEDGLQKLGKRIIEAIADSPGSNMEASKDTLFGVINGFTYFADHVRGRNPENRAKDAFFGEGERLKSEAMKVALDITGYGERSFV